jgi:ADP-heptose:LPS heptosyltransferase
MITSRPKLLAIRTGAMGDVCMLVPIIRSLQNFASVDWLVSEQHSGVVRSFPELACRILEATSDPRAPSPFPEALVQQLQREGYDFCLDFSHWPDVARLVARLQSIPVRATAHDPRQDALLKVNPDGIDLYGPFSRLVAVDAEAHQIEKWRQMVEAVCGIHLDLAWPAPERPLPNEGLRVFVQVHASKKIKRWPARYFASVLRGLRHRGPVHCLINAQPERYAQRLAWLLAFSSCRVERIPFDPTLRKLKDALQTADLALGCDSGPMHFAGLLGVPTVVIYGPYSAREFHPVGRTWSVSPPEEDLAALSVPLREVRAATSRLIDELGDGGAIRLPGNPQFSFSRPATEIISGSEP